jgi:hypothetical protein
VHQHRAGDPTTGEVVSHVGAGWVEVISVNQARRRPFRALGGRRTGIMGGLWRFPFSGDDELFGLLTRFEDLGLPLRSGADRAPAEVLASLRGRPAAGRTTATDQVRTSRG